MSTKTPPDHETKGVQKHLPMAMLIAASAAYIYAAMDVETLKATVGAEEASHSVVAVTEVFANFLLRKTTLFVIPIAALIASCRTLLPVFVCGALACFAVASGLRYHAIAALVLTAMCALIAWQPKQDR